MSRNRSEDAGFSLLETLLAITLFSMGMMSILMMVFTVTGVNRASKNLTAAVNLAQAKIDDLKVSPYAGIVDQTETALDSSGVSGGGIYDRSVTVTTSANPKYKTVDVTVSWVAGSAKQTSLMTIIAE